MSGQIVRVGFRVDVQGNSYFLTKLRLNPHETRTIDIRKLRDAQKPDFKGNLIPASAGDGLTRRTAVYGPVRTVV